MRWNPRQCTLKRSRGVERRAVGGDVIEYKAGTPRNQIYLFQSSLEELIERDNTVRFIDAYVESLEIGYAAGFHMA